MAMIAKSKGCGCVLLARMFRLESAVKWRVALINVNYPKYGSAPSSYGPGPRNPRLVSIGCSRVSVPHSPAIGGARQRSQSWFEAQWQQHQYTYLGDISRASVPESWAQAALWHLVRLRARMRSRARFAGSYNVKVPGHMLLRAGMNCLQFGDSEAVLG